MDNTNSINTQKNQDSFVYEEILPGVHLIAHSMDRESCSMEIIYHVGGSWIEEEKDRGKKHLLEHCIVARTKQMDHEQLKDWEFREDVMLNAYTSPVSMGLNAKGYKDDFKKMFDMLWEVAINPTFEQSDLDREKEIVLREISERRGDPNYKLFFTVQNQIFTPESLECHETLGSSQMVAQTTIEDFKRLHLQNLQESQLLICVSGGGIDIQGIRDQVISTYSKAEFARAPKPINFSPTSKLQDFKYKPIVDDLAHEHADISIYIPIPINFENRAERQIFSSLFTKYGGVLYDRLRDEKQLVYGISSEADKDLQCFIINMQAEIDLIEQIVEETKDIFSDFQKYFRIDKFNDFKNLIYKKQAIAKDHLGATAKFTKNSLTTYGIPEKYDVYTEKLKSVTEAQIENIYRAIQDNWENKRVVVVSKDKKVEELKI